MINGKRVLVVLPAYNAAHTLERTVATIPREVVDAILLVDDASGDSTASVARSLGLPTLVHRRNLGYGANQKTCYAAALERGADVVVMVHPDYQYDPRLVPSLAGLLAWGVYDVALGSRILGRGALQGGMPLHKYLANRLLTLAQNWLVSHKLSEYHTGYRGFTRQVLETLPLEANADGFVFDNQMLAQAIFFGFRIGEISCPTRYDAGSSSIGLVDSCRYGVGVLSTSLSFRLARWGLRRSAVFDHGAPRLNRDRLNEQADTIGPWDADPE